MEIDIEEDDIEDTKNIDIYQDVYIFSIETVCA